MKITVAAVAEHAWVENNCLSLCKTFDSVHADTFPYVLPRMSVALRLLINKSEAGEHKLNIALVDAEGRRLVNSDINIHFQPPHGSVPEASFSFALNGQNIVFPGAGDYAVAVLVDGRQEASIPVYVRGRSGTGPADIPDRI